MKSKSAFLLVIAAMATSAGAAVDIDVYGSGATSLDNNVTQTPFAIQLVTGANGSQSATGSGHQENVNSLYGLVSFASGAGFAFADTGVLRLKVDGQAAIGPGAPNVPTVTHGTPRVDVEFGASFEDSVAIVSGTLPVGSPATFKATIRMSVVTNYPGGYTGIFGFGYMVGTATAGYFFPNGLYTVVPTFDLDIPLEVTGQVGDVVPVFASLGARSDNRAGFYMEPGGGLVNYGAFSETHIDASHTARIFLDPITPGIELVSESGHNYSIGVVPEPQTYLLMLAGLVLVGVRMRQTTAARVRLPIDADCSS